MKERIAYIVCIDYPNIGSRGQRISQMCKEWQSAGYKTQIVIPFPIFNQIDPNTPRNFHLNGVPVRWLYNFDNKLGMIFNKYLKARSFAKEIEDIINTGVDCFILSQMDPFLSLIVIRQAHKRGIPVINEYMDIVFDLERSQNYTGKPAFEVLLRKAYFSLFNQLHNWLMTKVYLESDLLWLISEYLIKEAATIVSPQKIIKVPAIFAESNEGSQYSKDEILSEFNIKSNFIITYAGEFDWHQGVELLLEAFKKLHDKVPEVMLLLAGTVRSDNIPKLVKNYGLKESVRFLGYVEKNKLDVIYMISDVLAAPKLPCDFNEAGFSTKILDYLASGTVTLASKVGEQKSCFEDMKHLIFFDAGNRQQLYEKLLYIYENKNVAKDIGTCGREFVRDNFNAKKVMSYPIEKVRNLLAKP